MGIVLLLLLTLSIIVLSFLFSAFFSEYLIVNFKHRKNANVKGIPGRFNMKWHLCGFSPEQVIVVSQC